MNELLDDINHFSEYVSQVATWESSKDAIAKFSSDLDFEKQKDYIYELYCLLFILDSFEPSFSHKPIYVDRDGEKLFLLPKSPGLKKNFSRFEVHDTREGICVLQICCGTKIEGIAKVFRAPDISFQKPDSPLFPKADDVLFVHDSKYIEGEDCRKRIATHQFSTFTQVVRDLALVQKDWNDLRIGLVPDLIYNCILTNGLAHTSNDAYHKLNYVRCIECFHHDNRYRTVG